MHTSRRKKIRFITTTAAACLIIVACLAWTTGDAAASDPPAKAIGSQAAAQAQTLPLLVDVGADKCIPCKMMAPILEELKRDYSQSLKVEFVDVWKNPGAGKPYKIRLIPTQIFYDASGKELFRHEGFYSKEDILGKFKELGIELNKDQAALRAVPAKKSAATGKAATR